ncbi:hypothetical protein ACFY5H_27130 [Streptomyces sp. NPDC013012]|uniref:hypothetical protein n=1 Tax=Streptomyces sp. NPDC013012 TaxID=3364860 RepID=UPI00369CF360
MRRRPTTLVNHRLRAKHPFTLLAVSVSAPPATVPATTVPAPHSPATAAGPHGGNGCPADGLGPAPTALLDKTVEDVRRQARVPGLAVGL